MNLITLKELLPALSAAGMNIGLLGQPGVGKTEFVRDWALTLKASDIRPDLAEAGDDKTPVRFYSIACTTKESVDVSGLMQIENGVTRWAPPEWVPRGNEACVVFLDEFPQAELPTQLAFQKLIDRDLDGADVSPRALFVVAGNRVADNAGANEMPTHLRNRFAWFDIDTDVESWKHWASKNGVLEIIIDFISYLPKQLNTFDPKSKANAYATPRSITKLSRVLEKTQNKSHWMVLAAAICGPTWAAEFEQFRKLRESLPVIATLLASPDTHPLPDDFGVLNALSGTLVREAKLNRKHVDAVLTIIDRIDNNGQGEIASKTMRDLVAAVPALKFDPNADKLFNKIGSHMAG
jgi:hypothetical protein